MHQHPLGFLCFWFVLLPFFFLYLVLSVSLLSCHGDGIACPGIGWVGTEKGKTPRIRKGGWFAWRFGRTYTAPSLARKILALFSSVLVPAWMLGLNAHR